jgi:hypothetical protein
MASFAVPAGVTVEEMTKAMGGKPEPEAKPEPKPAAAPKRQPAAKPEN